MVKTSEIYRTLNSLRNKPLTKKDIKELKIRPSTIWTLEERQVIKETPEGYRITEFGSPLLNRFENERKKYGKSNVELVPKMIGGKITYEIKLKPNAELKVKEETQPFKLVFKHPKVYEGKKENIISFIQELDSKKHFVQRIEENKDFLIIETRLEYYRTLREKKVLDNIVEEIGMKIETEKTTADELCRKYFLKNEQTLITLISRKEEKRGFKSYKPLEIELDLSQPTETAKKLIKTLIERSPLKN